MTKVYRTAAGVVMEKELLLHEAVISNEAETVRRILEDREGLNVDCRNNFGMRALHMAAWYGQQDAVDVLLDAGALSSALDKKHRTLLMMVARSSGCSESLLEHILSRANLDPAIEARARDCDGCSVLHHAARAGETRAIQTLARILPELEIEARDQRGQTALHYACATGQQEAASCLLELGASARQQDYEGNTALHLAAANRESRLFAWLLSRCAAGVERTSLLRTADRRGYTALHLAASLGCSLILGDVLAELEREQQRPQALASRCLEGNTPLHLAAQMNQTQACDMLIDAGASLNALNTKMQTPLQLATEMGHSHVCRLLVAASEPNNVEASAAEGGSGSQQEGTALHVAARTSLASIANIIARTARLDYPAMLIKGTRAIFNSPEEP
ncbi:serine/threonine-protein phosphatase 6 regulatory ankyrin repeat subunit A isoform X2 [Nasonia vitripennis]|uniref:Uncharacterized protein n=1 Tax=Nasonia vitripennis TaxID=7425 RepID=A0A7M7QZ10_NASVI|nr:serine/threonine-protein phosphatase 6 regulatory ankyrin repeat subunit A isoform X2 [Nasonia vitripennis]XP_032454900.1 serine/threonine-protein phosphatase 6 regulatory ankyrin repeat subunit A isoform X2 [Nasonia vitripennis]